MAYDFRFQLSGAPQASSDGSGLVAHDITVVCREDPADPWAIVPARHKTILVPSDELAVALSQGTSQEKVDAYKGALVANLATVGVPIRGWDIASLTNLMDMNYSSCAAAGMANDFITLDLGLTYPVRFTI